MALANQFYLHRKNMPQTLRYKAALWWALVGTLPLNVGKVVQTRVRLPDGVRDGSLGAGARPWADRSRCRARTGGAERVVLDVARGRTTHRSSWSGTTVGHDPPRLVLDRSAEAAVPPGVDVPARLRTRSTARRSRGPGQGSPLRRRGVEPSQGAALGARRRAARGAGRPLPRRGVSLRRRGALSGLRPREGKERFGDKTPAYLHAVDELLAIWPEARIVVLVRDARDVTLSIAKLPFGPNNPYAAAAWWARGVRAGLAAERRHPQQVLTVRYEDLVGDPEPTVKAVCAHVRLGYNSEMLAIERAGPGKIVSEQADWYTGVSSPISTAASGRWRTTMSEDDRRVVVAVAGPELEELGYEAGDVVAVACPCPGVQDARRRAARSARLPSASCRSAGASSATSSGASWQGRENDSPARAACVKRVLDPVAAALGLVVLSPVYAAIAAAVVVDSGRPVLVVSHRAGKDGRPFRMLKFRTMVLRRVRVGPRPHRGPRSRQG